MYIYCEIVAPNGASTRVHKITRVEISEDVRVFTNSFASEDSIMTIWQQVTEMPTSVLSTAAYPESIYTFLISPSGPFPGGVILQSPTDLDKERVRIQSLIGLERDRHITGGVETPSGRVDSDEVSIRNIMGSYQSATLALMTKSPFETQWRLADNSMVTLDAMAMIGIGNAVLAHVRDCYARSWELKAEIGSAETVDDLAAVSIETGWPN